MIKEKRVSCCLVLHEWELDWPGLQPGHRGKSCELVLQRERETLGTD